MADLDTLRRHKRVLGDVLAEAAHLWPHDVITQNALTWAIDRCREEIAEAERCTTCRGSGERRVGNDYDEYRWVACTACNGTGNREVSRG